MSLGTKLSLVMGKEKITAYRISKETGIQQSYISRLVHDKLSPSYRTLKRVLDVMGYEIQFVKSQKGRR